MNMTDWTGAESVAMITADELERAATRIGIAVLGCFLDSETRIVVHFNDIRDAETMLSLAVPASDRPDTLYDRATERCVTLADPTLVESMGDAAVEAAIETAWNWTIHPTMTGRRMDWHVSVGIPVDDAATVAAALNRLPL